MVVQRRALLVAGALALVIPALDAAIVASAFVAIMAFVVSTVWVRRHALPTSLRALHGAVGLFTLGIVIRIVEAGAAGGELVFPGIADAVFLPAYAVSIWAMTSAAMSRHALAKMADLLDAVAVAIVAATLILPFSSDVIFGSGVDPVERFTWLGYAVAQAVFLGVVVLLIFGPGARSPGLAYLIVSCLYLSVFDTVITVLQALGFDNLADQALRAIAVSVVTYAAATSFATWPEFARPGIRPQTHRWFIYGIGFVVLGAVLVVEPGPIEVIGMVLFGLVSSIRIGSGHTVASRLETLNDSQIALAAELADADEKHAVLQAGHDACLRLVPKGTEVRIDIPGGFGHGPRLTGPTISVTSADSGVQITAEAQQIRSHHWSGLAQIADVVALASEAVEARAERVSERVKADWRALSGTDHELVFIVDGDLRVTKATPNVELVLAVNPIGEHLPELLNEPGLSPLKSDEEIIIEQDGRWFSITGQRGENDTQIVTVRDVTARLTVEFVDPVTGLNNMTHFARLGQLEAATLIVFQIADFSRVNDLAGKAGADQLLAEIGSQLQQAFRADIDQVWRNHGPSFAVLCQGPDKPDQWILDRRDYVAASVKGTDYATTFKLITAVVPIDEPIDVAEALHKADVAIAFDSASRRGGIARYSSEVAERAQREYRIDAALAAVHDPATAGFRVHYQPIVEAGTERIARIEALLRWEHSTIGTIRPDEFIPAAERSGQVGLLDQFVMEVATQDLREVQHLDPSVQMQINLSPVGLTPERICDIANWVRANCADPPSLTIEIIESAIDRDFDELLPAFHQLRDAGVGVSVDDFGVGHSSMERIARPEAPWTQVKLAGVFASGIHADTVARVIDTIHSLEFEVVVENVEERDQADMMTDAGADFIQGWLFARDMPLDRLIDFIGSYEMSRVQGRSNR